METIDHGFHEINVQKHCRFIGLFMRIVISPTAFDLHRYEHIRKILYLLGKES